jgi:lysophospholipase L1-like esterase
MRRGILGISFKRGKSMLATMKKFFLGLVLIGSWTRAHAAPLVQANDNLAICGDSITAQHLYSAYIEDYLLMCAPPVENLGINQFGWGGETAPGFLTRLDSDVFPFKPTIATTCYGMNDGGYRALTDDIANTYRKAQTDIVETMKKNGVTRIVLGSPKCVDSYFFKNPNATPEVYNKTLSALADIDKDIAAKEGVVYADVFDATTDAMTKAKTAKGADYPVGGGDGVHPYPNGHIVMAYAFLKALGYDGAISTITVDLDANKADATAGTKVVSCDKGTVNLESTRYPFCFTGHLTDTDANNTAGILPFVPFNQDLNRYILVVKGVKTKAKITWGSETHEYSGDDLAKGVNLMDQFMDNPFAGPFSKVNQAVQMQQAYEEALMQTCMHNLKNYQNTFPGVDGLEQWQTQGMALRETLYKRVQAMVTPVDHAIKIEKED